LHRPHSQSFTLTRAPRTSFLGPGFECYAFNCIFYQRAHTNTSNVFLTLVRKNFFGREAKEFFEGIAPTSFPLLARLATGLNYRYRKISTYCFSDKSRRSICNRYWEKSWNNRLVVWSKEGSSNKLLTSQLHKRKFYKHPILCEVHNLRQHHNIFHLVPDISDALHQ